MTTEFMFWFAIAVWGPDRGMRGLGLFGASFELVFMVLKAVSA